MSTTTNVTMSTAQAPYTGGPARGLLLEALDKSIPVYRVALVLPTMAEELERTVQNVYNFNLWGTIKDMKPRPGDRWAVVMMLNLLIREALKSIVQGTVAYDNFLQTKAWYDAPLDNTPVSGIYVIGLYRTGTPGEFLNGTEMKELIQGLRDYIAGSRVMSKPGVLSTRERQDIQWVKTVDAIRDAYQHGPVPSPAFYTSPNPQAIDVLLATFEERSKELDRLDPSGQVRQRQSPLYVGCSINLKERLSRYKNAKSTNKPLNLTMSILEAKNIPVQMCQVVALRTIRAGQLPLAERLVTTLASSLIYQNGFNVAEAGGNSPLENGSWNDAMWHVLGVRRHVGDGLEELLKEAKSRAKFLRRLDTITQRYEEMNETLNVLRQKQIFVMSVLQANTPEGVMRLRREEIALQQRRVRGMQEATASLALSFSGAFIEHHRQWQNQSDEVD